MHICFADDLLMFCKADIDSIQLMQDALQRFSEFLAYRQTQRKVPYMSLEWNQPDLKQKILATLDYVEGEMPSKYLGVPISSKRLTVAQRMPLVESWKNKMLDS